MYMCGERVNLGVGFHQERARTNDAIVVADSGLNEFRKRKVVVFHMQS